MWRLVNFILLFFIIVIGSMILVKSMEYYSPDFTTGYLKSKKDFFDGIFKYGLYGHIITAPIILFCGTVQFFTNMKQKYTQLHRVIGFIYIILILFISSPSGLILAMYASGGPFTKLCFLVLSSLWFYFTYKGLLKIKNKQYDEHNNFMLRSYALTASAIILRILSFIFIHHLHWKGPSMYLTISWLSWVPIWLMAELYIHSKKRK